MTKLALGVAATIAMAQAAAAADTIKLTGETFTNGSQTGTIWAWSPATWTSVEAGRFKLTGTDLTTNKAVSFTSYCIDIAQALGNGNYTLQTLNGSGLMSAAKQSQLNALIANGDPLVTDATTSAAMQLAVWEIVYENAGIGFGMSSGNFGAYGGEIGAALGLAGTYLGKVASGAWAADSNLSLSVLTSGTQQDQLIFSRAVAPPAVPEPATWATMIGGFGAVGTAMRRRRAAVPARA